MAVDTATELLFLDTFKHQSAEVTRRGRWGRRSHPRLPSSWLLPAASCPPRGLPGPRRLRGTGRRWGERGWCRPRQWQGAKGGYGGGRGAKI